MAQGVWTQYTVVTTTTTTQTQDRVDEVVTQKEGLVLFRGLLLLAGADSVDLFPCFGSSLFGRTPEGNKNDLSGPRLVDYTVPGLSYRSAGFEFP